MIDQRGGHAGGQRRQKVLHRVGAFAGAEQQGRLLARNLNFAITGDFFTESIVLNNSSTLTPLVECCSLFVISWAFILVTSKFYHYRKYTLPLAVVCQDDRFWR
jgi:hypothetical protein